MGNTHAQIVSFYFCLHHEVRGVYDASEQKFAANNFVIFNGCGNLLNVHWRNANLIF